MKSSEDTQETTTTSLSEPTVKLLAYEFSPEELTKIVQDTNQIDPEKDLKAAKKARKTLKDKINEVKKVHTANKKLIDQFKKDSIAYDLHKFTVLTDELSKAFEALDGKINSIENAAIQKKQSVIKMMSDIELDISKKILDSKNDEDIQLVQIEISSIAVDQSVFDDQTSNMEEIKRKLMIRASNRAIEIKNAGGTIPDANIDPIKMESGISIEPQQKYSDSELINVMEQMGAPGKGWIAMSGSNGFALYQVDDPKAPKSVRMALQIALEQHKNSTI